MSTSSGHRPQRRRHRAALGTLDAIKADPRSRGSSSGRATAGSTARTTARDPRLLRREPGGHARAPRVRARRRRAGDPARHRHGPEPGRVPAARARGLPDHLARLRRRRPRRPPDRGGVDARGGHGRAGRARPVATTTATASSRSASRSASRATRPKRSCARSWRARSSARPSSTWSPTACPSRVTVDDASRGRPPTGPSRSSIDALELTARTEAGARLVALAEALAGEIAPRAADHDRDGELPLRQLRAPSSAAATSPRRSPSSSADSASRPSTTSWWRRAGSLAATPR